MRRRRDAGDGARRASVLMTMIAVLVLSPLAAAGWTPLPVLRSWTGVVVDDAALSAVPDGWRVDDAATWDALWRTWAGGGEPPPAVDFARYTVLVAVALGPNAVSIQPLRDGNGTVDLGIAATKIGGPGFGYLLAEVEREGIERVVGGPLLAR
ncbi:MAG: hypothetical protein H6982_00370 [Chromatiales bacterium]|nr:hypothetical protein [Chromatiales bacterium]